MTRKAGISHSGFSVTELSIARKQLLEKMLKLPPERKPPSEALTPSCGPAPLSYAQQRLWFLARMHPESPAYHMTPSVRWHGRLNISALRQALNVVVERHAALRTAFSSINGVPRQEARPPMPVELRFLDFQALPAPAQAARLEDALRAEIEQPFDLASGKLLRAAVIKLGAEDHVLQIVVHHIAADAWSLDILYAELARIYGALLAGQPVELPPLPIQYADFARWQQNKLTSGALSADLSFWKKQLAALSPLHLAASLPRPGAMSSQGRRHEFRLGADLTLALRKLSRRETASDFMLLLAAFQTLLMRYTGQDDVAVGAPVAHRTSVETERLIGCFINTLVLRANFADDPAFDTLLRRVRDTALEAYAHQEYPFEKLVEELKPERDQGQNPLFQVMFAFQNTLGRPAPMPGLAASAAPVPVHSAKFDLTLVLYEDAGEFAGYFEYRTDLFLPESIERLTGHFKRLLEGIAANSAQRVSELPLLGDNERRQLLHEWNRTQRQYPRDLPLHVLFEEQVRHAPDAVAVRDNGGTLSYAQLDRRANRLAHYLRRHGVGPGTPVALCLDRSERLLVGMLGVLKAGGAYLPLDPEFPAERLAFMLQESRAPFLLTEERLKAALPRFAGRVFALDADWPLLANESEETPAPSATGTDPAYIIYTSGSTGNPKGVVVPQRAVARLVLNADYIQIAPSDRLAQLSTFSFDAATFEVWGALLNGASLTIIPKETVLSPKDFAALLLSERITILFVTTALFNLLVDENPDVFASLDAVLFGGEAADARRVRKLLQHKPPRRLLNMYGPTETTTFATWHELREIPEEAASIPIGRPIANTEAYVLDAHRQPVPVGVPGELHLGGDGVACGYLEQPELTAAKFLPHPFNTQPGAQLYRTGDLVRHRADGALEFLGRTDHQIKLRGFRIELGEIEAALLEHPELRHAVVAARISSSGDKLLVAYIVPKASPVDHAELRRRLAKRLPAFMLPSAIVTLNELPLNRNGKVDRTALPEPDELAAEKHGTAGAWLTLHHQLMQLWEELLGVPGVGLRDNFFELGGHSLLAVRMLDRVERMCGQKLPLGALFENATIESLAQFILRSNATAREPFQTFNSSGARPPFFFLHGDVGGAGLYTRNLARHLGASQPFFVFHPHGTNGFPLPPDIESMAAQHVRELRAIAPHGPYFLGGFCVAGLVAVEMARQLAHSGESVAQLILIETLPAGKLLRFMRRTHDRLALLRNMDRSQRALDFDGWLNFNERWTAFLHAPPGQKWQSLRRRVGALFGRASAGDRQTADSSNAHALDLMRAYQWTAAGYRPPRCSARVSLILSAATSSLAQANPGAWKAFAKDLTFYSVPGDHLSCVTRHGAALAGRLKACLEEDTPPIRVDGAKSRA